MQILSNHISALNVRESPKFSRVLVNRGRGMEYDGWRQIILDRSGNMAVSCMRNASGDNYRNSSFIVDEVMWQIPRSTERISSLI